ncbi:MAG: gliding motility-associated C-terminal domain-containing protein [Flavobacteriaceae bacterium]
MKKILFSLIILSLYGCPNDEIIIDEEPQDATHSCCGENPFENTNVNNLDESLGEISMWPIVTHNNDGFNDFLIIDNLIHYPNNELTIFDKNEAIIFQTSSYGVTGIEDVFPRISDYTNNTLPIDGVYKYKLVVENEDTFLKFGFICLITRDAPDSPMSTAECDLTLVLIQTLF